MAAILRTADAPMSGAILRIGFLATLYADLLLTLLATQHGFVELNPFMAHMLARPWELFMFKVVAPTFIAFLVSPKFLIPSTAFMLAVTGWNLVQLTSW